MEAENQDKKIDGRPQPRAGLAPEWKKNQAGDGPEKRGPMGPPPMGPDGKPQMPDYYVAPPIYDEEGNKIEYGKNGCPKGRDLSQFECPCNFPKCVYIKENAECFERMMKERQNRN